MPSLKVEYSILILIFFDQFTEDFAFVGIPQARITKELTLLVKVELMPSPSNSAH